MFFPSSFRFDQNEATSLPATLSPYLKKQCCGVASRIASITRHQSTYLSVLALIRAAGRPLARPIERRGDVRFVAGCSLVQAKIAVLYYYPIAHLESFSALI